MNTSTRLASAAHPPRAFGGGLGLLGAALVAFVVSVASLVLCGGCAAPAGLPVLPPDLGSAKLSPRSGETQVAFTPAEVPAEWWVLLNDETLNSLQRRAAVQNTDVEMALTVVAQSRARLGIANAQRLPSVGADAAYVRNAFSENGPMAALGAPTQPTNLAQLEIDAQWEIDLWGRTRQLRDSAAASAESAAYDANAAQVTLAGEVARDYFLLRGAQVEAGIVAQNLSTAQHTLRLVRSREANGVASRYETASARAQVASTEALRTEVAHRQDSLLNALGLLLAQPPRALDAELSQPVPPPVLPRVVPVGLPSQLAHRRPDILSAEARLRAATATVAAANADFYPRLSLSGSFGWEALEGSDLLGWSSRRFTVGPAVYLPIFEGGRLKSTLALTQARQQQAAIAYRRTVLAAWHEIDDAIDAYASALRRQEELERALRENTVAFESARRLYQQGVSDYLAVLVAQRGLLGSQSAAAANQAACGVALVSLFKALGGGWEPAGDATAVKTGMLP
jgi:NodT family efflux transporter outer membrane factor (OMF) lipoprotein